MSELSGSQSKRVDQIVGEVMRLLGLEEDPGDLIRDTANLVVTEDLNVSVYRIVRQRLFPYAIW